ncbi:MAG TPA: hypothetical protein VGS22_16620 [Thermoanaerobaculia bacterium]|jgi:hypothetical protein|nr:hypothetical protein [Thermoanaerobaculia bacterium]
MRRTKNLLWGLTLALLLSAGMPAGASTFGRVGLDYLVAENDLIVLGEVLSARSYWNGPGTLILTDVQVSVSETLKGKTEQEITVTLPGGTVGDDRVAVLGGAELIPGNSYVLFLRQGELPGVKDVRVVRDHSQGVFELQLGKNGLRVVSQAARLNIVPDAFAQATTSDEGPGLQLRALRQSILDLVARGTGSKEVKP